MEIWAVKILEDVGGGGRIEKPRSLRAQRWWGGRRAGGVLRPVGFSYIEDVGKERIRLMRVETLGGLDAKYGCGGGVMGWYRGTDIFWPRASGRLYQWWGTVVRWW